MPSFDNFPDSNFSQTAHEAAEDAMILDSQPPTARPEETQDLHVRFSQFDSLANQTSVTQATELSEPTQDSGFRNVTPLKQRFVEPPASTISTVALESQAPEEEEPSHSESPLVQRANKLRRRVNLAPVEEGSGDEGEGEETQGDAEYDEFGFGTSAFSMMKDAARKNKRREQKQAAKEAFDRKKSKAKEMVEEQAEESEDEYAGLGGADGEDSSDDDASVNEMIDDETKNNEVDDAKLAAFYA